MGSGTFWDTVQKGRKPRRLCGLGERSVLEERSQLPDDLLLRVVNGEHIMSVLASAVPMGEDGSVDVQKLLGAGPEPAPRVIEGDDG